MCKSCHRRFVIIEIFLRGKRQMCGIHFLIGTPGAKPYGSCLSDMNLVEINMELR